MRTTKAIDYPAFVADFEWTRTRHGGDTIAAAMPASTASTSASSTGRSPFALEVWEST